MASSSTPSEEQLNYLKVCLIATDELPEGLREIFKREWDNRYKATLGEWKDKPKNGMDFWDRESSLSGSRNACLLEIKKMETELNGIVPRCFMPSFLPIASTVSIQLFDQMWMISANFVMKKLRVYHEPRFPAEIFKMWFQR